MASPGRKKKLDRPVEWKLHIPFSVASKVDIIQLDPRTGLPEFGARSRLVTELLKKWLDEQGVQT